MVEQINNNKDNLYIIHIIQQTQELNHIHHQVHHHRIPQLQLRLRQMKMNLEVKENWFDWGVLFFLSIDFLIGYGAFGVIWAVTDPRTSRRVALKKMPNVFQSVIAARRAFREIKMLCTFRHDNVNQPSSPLLIENLFCFVFFRRFYKLWIFCNPLVK